MATNNYFGFAAAATPYNATPTQTSYPAGQAAAAYTVQHSAEVYSTAVAQQQTTQPTYETYQAASHAASAFPYAPQQQATYEKTQHTYYQPQVSYSTSGTSPYVNAPLYVQQPTVVTQPTIPQVLTTQSSITNSDSTPRLQTNSWMSFKKRPLRFPRSRIAPKPEQLHYCEVCKISCGGPQTYKEHLIGQKHKKKEASSKIGASISMSRGGTTLRCELCDVTCTGSDAYAAHIRGSKHQKVVKLHTKLGKPIPSTEPQVVSTKSNAKQADGNKAITIKKTANGTTVMKTLPPKINFASAGTFEAEKTEVKKEPLEENSDKIEEKEVLPVGQAYIEEIKNDDGKVLSFQCKLCDCRFSDPNAKEMHMKGRRHRLQYKRKVNPALIVDIKPSLRQRKIQEDKFRRQQVSNDYWKMREDEQWRKELRMVEGEGRMYWEERRRFEEEMEHFEWFRGFRREPHIGPPVPPLGPYMVIPPTGLGYPILTRPITVDDRHVLAKHTQIYPKEEELSAIQKIIIDSEKALKLVSDFLAECGKKAEPKGPCTSVTTAVEEAKEKNDLIEVENLVETAQQYRVLKGVMRVGVLAKGLFLTGDLRADLVVMCAEKPTQTLLKRVIDNLPKQLEAVEPDGKYEVKCCVDEAAIIVSSTVEPKIYVTVTFTSPVIRNSNAVEGSTTTESIKDPLDVLDRQKCLEALAALRHAKWFQAKSTVLKSCVIVNRILRDFCQRVPSWSHMNNWTMELLVEKVLSSARQALGPGDALRYIFEAVASGALLPGSSGLLDPCEKEPINAAGSLTTQEREDITASAQNALRLIAFRQIHKVLAMNPLPAPNFTHQSFPRKRGRDIEDTTDAEGSQNGKKNKKEDGLKVEPIGFVKT